jgi:hypothetical protein
MPLSQHERRQEFLNAVADAFDQMERGTLTPTMLERINGTIRAITSSMLQKGRHVLIVGLEAEEDQMMAETGLNEQVEYALSSEQRILYNLLNKSFGKLVPLFKVVQALSIIRPDLMQMTEEEQSKAIIEIYTDLAVLLMDGDTGLEVDDDTLWLREPPCDAFVLRKGKERRKK